MRAWVPFFAMLAAAVAATAAAYALGAPGGTPAIVFLFVLYGLIRVHRARVDERIAADLRTFAPERREQLLARLKPRAQRRIRRRLERMER